MTADLSTSGTALGGGQLTNRGITRRTQRGSEVVVVLPTYNERENLRPMLEAILAELPGAQVLVVDDNSPDGSGQLADAMAARETRIRVLHRSEKTGLGDAYRAGFSSLLSSAHNLRQVIIQMDSDFSHDPADLPRLLHSLAAGADLALGSRYAAGGSTVGWDRRRRAISRTGNLYARIVLGLPYRDLTGGFKAWRRELLAELMTKPSRANGYGFQIELTWNAHRARARIVEIPIVFRERFAGKSKMNAGIVKEALLLVLRLRLKTLAELSRRPTSRPSRRA